MSRISVGVLTAVALLLAPAALPQSQRGAASTPRFDAASIKRIAPGTPSPKFDPAWASGPRQHGRYTCPNTTLKSLLRDAYAMPFGRVLGPEWLDSENYSLATTMPAETPDDQVGLMLQNLLKERFQVKVHFETRETPVYALTVAKNGPKLKVNTAAEGKPSRLYGRGPYGCEGSNMHIEALAVFFSLKADRMVIDMTGLSGTYDFTLDWSAYASPHPAEISGAPMANGGMDGGLPAMLRSLASIGLKADARKVPLKFLIVDHAEKIPTEN
jgi:uncharacterized protein (TIGR03435 family)